MDWAGLKWDRAKNATFAKRRYATFAKRRYATFAKRRYVRAEGPFDQVISYWETYPVQNISARPQADT